MRSLKLCRDFKLLPWWFFWCLEAARDVFTWSHHCVCITFGVKQKIFRSAHVSCPLQCQCHPVSFLSKALCSSKIFLNSHFFLSVPIRIFVTFYITENILLFLWRASFKVDDSTVLPESPVCDWKSTTWVFYWLHISGSKLPTWPIKKQKNTKYVDTFVAFST